MDMKRLQNRGFAGGRAFRGKVKAGSGYH